MSPRLCTTKHFTMTQSKLFTLVGVANLRRRLLSVLHWKKKKIQCGCTCVYELLIAFSKYVTERHVHIRQQSESVGLSRPNLNLSILHIFTSMNLNCCLICTCLSVTYFENAINNSYTHVQPHCIFFFFQCRTDRSRRRRF
jgi:hypothetical protein